MWLTAVAGVKVAQAKLRDLLLARIEQCAQEEVQCYLLDDGGYVVLSSKEQEDREVRAGGGGGRNSNWCDEDLRE